MVALACLADESFGLKTARWLQREKNFLAQALIKLKGFAPYPSSANFLLVRIANGTDALELRFSLEGKSHPCLHLCWARADFPCGREAAQR
jgi:histidinol-phosphate/aromatic aminotransferase/cobyric acid decarboxylase-like protein